MTLDAFLELLGEVKPAGNGYVGRCPAHDDRIPSLSITDGGDRILLTCHANCATQDVVEALGLSWKDLFYDGEAPPPQEPEAEYVYVDEHGDVLYRVLRYPGKRFKQERWAYWADCWLSGLQDTRRVLYHLPHLVLSTSRGRTVYICEGEKDADALWNIGKPATCNLGGAGKGKWLATYVRFFRDANVIVVADKDEEGQGLAHARYIAESLQGIARSLWIVQARAGKDAADHLAAGYPVEAFEVLEGWNG